MVAFLAALAGIIVGAVLSTVFEHRAWLRDRRLTEYANLLTTFRAVFAKVGDAIRARETSTAADPGQDPQALAREAAKAVGDFYLAHDRVKLVATTVAKRKADLLWDYVHEVRASNNDDRPDPQLDGEYFFEVTAPSAHAASNDFVETAVKDVLHLRLRRGR